MNRWAAFIGIAVALAAPMRLLGQAAVPVSVTVQGTVDSDAPDGGYISLEGRFLPTTPMGSDADRFADDTRAAGESIGATIFQTLAQPGKPYVLTITGDAVSDARIEVRVPDGFRVILDNLPRPAESVQTGSQVSFQIIPKGRDPQLAAYSSPLAMNQLDWRVPLGALVNGDDAGEIGIMDAGVDAAWAPLFTPARLFFAPTSDTVQAVWANNALRQVIAPQVVIDVQVINATSYALYCYNPNQVAGSSGGIKYFSGMPLVTYIVSQGVAQSPDPTAIAFRIAKAVRNNPTSAVVRNETTTLERSGAWPNFCWTKRDWYHDTETPLSETITQSSWSAGVRTEVTTVRTPGAASGALTVTRTYKIITGVGEMISSELLGTSDASPLQIEHYGTDITAGYISRITMPGGGVYELTYSGSNLFSVRQPFAGMAAGGATQQYEWATDEFGVSTKMGSQQTTIGPSVVRWSCDYAYPVGSCVATGETRCGTQSLGSIVKTFTPDGSTMNAGKTYWEVHPDGTTIGTSFTFFPTSYVVDTISGANSPTGFTIGGDTMNGVYLVANRSVRAKMTYNAIGQLAKKETWLAGYDSYGGASLRPTGWTTYAYNALGQCTDRAHSDGTAYHADYDGFLKTGEKDESGVATTYTYDAMGRVGTMTRAGAAGVASLTTTYTYDAAGNVLTESVGDPSAEQLVTTRTYDNAGRLSLESKPGGFDAVTHSYSAANRTHTATHAGGGNVTEVLYYDGRIASRTGTGILSEYHCYTPGSDGSITERVDFGSPTSSRWRIERRDWHGTVIHTETPGVGGASSLSSDFFVDYYTGFRGGRGSTGRVYRSVHPGPAGGTLVMRTDYDAMGNVWRSGLDPDDNGLYSGSSDRITETATYIEWYNGEYWLRKNDCRYPNRNDGTCVVIGYSRTRIGGFSGNLVAEVQTGDADGNITVQKTTLDRATATKTVTTTRTGITGTQVDTYICGLLVKSLGPDGVTTSTSYDALRRPATVTDGRNNTTTTTYVTGTTLPSTVIDATTTVVSTTHYDSAGRKDWVQDAKGQKTYFAYNRRDQLIRQWGPGTYPVEYAYNSFGEKVAMRTFRNPSQDFTTATWPLSDDGADPLNPDPSAWTVGDKTTWTYDAGTGLLAAKADASGRCVSYTYNAANQLATRDWSRTLASGDHVRTSYSYDPTTGDQTGVSYNDGTPSVVYTRTRLGQPDTATDVTGVHDFVYDPVYPNRLACEAFDTFYGSRTMTRLYTTSGTLGVPCGFQLGSGVGSTTDLQQSYGYDTTTGRLATVSTSAAGVAAATRTFRYGYEPNTSLVKTLWTDDNAFFVTRSFEANRDVLVSIDSKWGQAASTSLTNYVYHTNSAMQRDSVVQSGDAFPNYAGTDHAIHETFNYNPKGELTQAPTYQGNDASDTTTPLANRQHEYSYDQIGNRLWAGVTGNSSDRKNYGANALNQITSRDNPSAPFGGSQSYTYDADGNLTNDGLWSYTWDAENRLTSMTATAASVAAGNPNLVLMFQYDYQGRRVEKKVINQASNGGVTLWRRFLYDGWNMVAEFNVNPQTAALSPARSYTWGLDIAHSLTTSGGVGALLQIADYSSGKACSPTYDGNGNIVSAVNCVTGELAAAYEYSPYGEQIRLSAVDSAVADQPFRFSTKYLDAETGYLGYGHRYYDQQNGRFIGRDGIEEKGGINLYGFCTNGPVNKWDVLGNWPSIESNPVHQRSNARILLRFPGMVSIPLQTLNQLDKNVDALEYQANSASPMHFMRGPGVSAKAGVQLINTWASALNAAMTVSRGGGTVDVLTPFGNFTDVDFAHATAMFAHLAQDGTSPAHVDLGSGVPKQWNLFNLPDSIFRHEATEKSPGSSDLERLDLATTFALNIANGTTPIAGNFVSQFYAAVGLSNASANIHSFVNNSDNNGPTVFVASVNVVGNTRAAMLEQSLYEKAQGFVTAVDRSVSRLWVGREFMSGADKIAALQSDGESEWEAGIAQMTWASGPDAALR